jgi:hypothetical protein
VGGVGLGRLGVVIRGCVDGFTSADIDGGGLWDGVR